MGGIQCKFRDYLQHDKFPGDYNIFFIVRAHLWTHNCLIVSLVRSLRLLREGLVVETSRLRGKGHAEL